MIDALTSESFLMLVAINAIAAVGMNLVYVTGQLNLGQAGFAAIGAYTVAVVDVELGWALAPTLVAGALVAAAVALPVAIGANRVRGIYLIMGTLAVGELVHVAIGNIDAVGGLQGYSGQDPVSSAGVYATLGVVVILSTALMASGRGLRMRSIFDDEDAAAAAGVATRRVKVLAVVASAAVVAVSGGLLAKWLLFIAPRNFAIALSFQIALYTLVGGVHSLLGALAGAITISVLLEVLGETSNLDYVPSMFHFLSNWRLVVYGGLVMVLMPLLPEGLVSRQTALRLTAPIRAVRRRLTEREPERPKGARTDVASDRPLLELEAIGHRFGGVRALKAVNLTVAAGEIVALIGANGAGKTTLINVASGGLPCQAGTIRVAGKDVTHKRAETRTRAGISRTFQSVRVFAHLTVEETIRLGAQAASPGGPTVAQVLDLIGLGDRKDSLPDRLTLAEQRRLEVGRAIASHPLVVLLDEPSVGMNGDERAELATLVRSLRDMGMSIVLVDHNLDLALGTAERVVVLDFGEVIAAGSASDILHDARVQEAYLGTPAPDSGFGEEVP